MQLKSIKYKQAKHIRWSPRPVVFSEVKGSDSKRILLLETVGMTFLGVEGKRETFDVNKVDVAHPLKRPTQFLLEGAGSAAGRLGWLALLAAALLAMPA